MSTMIKRYTKRKVYYNVSIPHNDLLSEGGSPTSAVFNEVRDEPLFNGAPRDWTMSVIRFTIPTSFIPIQYFPVEEDPINPLNPNKSIYSITLSYNGNDFQQYLEWISPVPSVPIPPPPTGLTGKDFQYNPIYLSYYGMYSYQHFVSLINTALATCFNNNIIPLLPVYGTYEPPYFTFNPVTKLFSLFTQSIFLDSNAIPVEIWLNTYLNNNFDSSFDEEYYGYETNITGKNIRFKIKDRGVGKKIPDVNSPDGYVYEQIQDYITISTMQSFTSLILRSVSLPIVNEAITLQPKSGVRDSIGSGSESIISDFEIDIGAGNQLKPSVHYNPTAEYRRITMHGETPIQRIDIEVFWKDNYDNLYPVLIPSHDIVTIKILFEEL